MKKKILFILPSLEFGGAEKVMVVLYNHINRLEFEPYFCVFKNGILYKKISEKNKITILNKHRVMHGITGLLKTIYKINPDIVFSTHCHLNAFICLLKKVKLINAKVVIRESNFLSVQQSSSKSFYEKNIVTWFIKKAYPFADSIICQTEEMKKDLQLFVSNSKINPFVIHNPIENIPEYIKTLTVPRIISIGRLEKQKNHSLVIEAFDLIKNIIPHHLVIIGNGSERDSINMLIESKGLKDRVKLVGFIENVWDEYSGSSLFVLPSNYEGFPNVIIEAMANSIPVISTNCPSGPKEIIEDNINGLLSPVENKKILSEKMLYVLQNKSFSEMIRNNAHKFVSKFSTSNIVKKYESVYLS